jgi:hypothetical protein
MLKRTELKRKTGLKQGGGQLSRASAPMKRTEMKRGTPMQQNGGFARPEPGSVRKLGIGGLMRLAGARAGDEERPIPKPRQRTRLKSSSPRMTPIRASARDEPCTLRFPGVCNCRTDTTVLCHRNGAGGGMKAPDTDAAYGCYACHMVLDGQAPRPQGFTRDRMLELFERAVARTHARLVAKGVLTAEQLETLLGQQKKKPLTAGTGNGLVGTK